MAKQKPDIQETLRLVCYRGKEVAINFELTKKKILIGSNEICDLHLIEDHISFYHAFISLDEEGGGKIIDLDSTNGIYINGKKVKRSYFHLGDVIRFANLDFYVETTGQEALLEDQDEGQAVIEGAQDVGLPLTPSTQGLILIDGEYCDIVFDEENFKPVWKLPTENKALSFSDYIDIEDENTLIFPILENQEHQSLEVAVMTSGTLMSVDYLSIKNRTYYLSQEDQGSTKVLCEPISGKETPFIRIQEGGINALEIPDFKAFDFISQKELDFDSGGASLMGQEDSYMYLDHTNQIVVRMSNHPPNLRSVPPFAREKESIKIWGKVLLPLLLLLAILRFIPNDKLEVKKEIPVVYKVVKKKKLTQEKEKQELSSQEKTENQKQEGQRQEKVKEDKKKVSRAAPPQPQEQKPAEQKSSPQPSPKQAKQKVVQKKQKQKSYRMDNLKSNIKDLFAASSKNTNTDVRKREDVLAANPGFKASRKSNSKSLNGRISTTVAGIGSDYSGNMAQDYGTKGLSKKSGIDSSYIEPNTKLLGSMDPSLLRKILREYLPQFKHCYQQELLVNESIQGVIRLNFRISSSGRASNIGVVPNSGASFTGRGKGCMANVLRLIDFPKPKGGGVVDVSQPLNFSAERVKI